jgi:hypothetical protein
VYGLAVSADPYPMVLAPIVLGYAAVVAYGAHGRPDLVRRAAALGAGAASGLVPFVLLHRAARAKSGPMGLSLDPSHLRHNWDLLVHECLPWALSYKVYFAQHVMDYAPWDAPAAAAAIMIAGALGVLAIVTLGIALVRRTSIPVDVRRLGFFGAATYPIAIGGFLVSVMVMDHFSMRYLAVLTVMLPFAAAPAAHSRGLGARRYAALIAAHLVASSLGGWVGYGPFVHGLVPVAETPELADDYTLYDLLRARGVAYAEADYWASYRLTLLFGERLVVVPTNAAEDRYAPYRRAFEAAPVYAYVFDPGRSRESLAGVERELSGALVEKTRAGGHTVFIVTR